MPNGARAAIGVFIVVPADLALLAAVLAFLPVISCRHMSAAPDPISLNDFRRAWRSLGSEAASALERVGQSGWFILGREVEAFEAELASEWGLPHAVGVGNGLDALEIGLRCLGIGAGDRVLTTPLSAFATTLAVLRVGAVPVFVDIDRFGLLDLTAAEERLRRGGIRCLLPVHLYGHVVDLERLTALGSEFGVAVVEDCAQSIGSRFRGAPSGSAGEIAATSFYPTKNLGALGDAGALLCRNPDFAQHSRRLRNYGEADRYQHVEVGLNSRLDELQAALLRSVMLPRLEAWTTRRKEAAATYLDGIRNPRITVPGSPPGSASVWHLFPVLVEPQRRSHFREHLTQHGVSSAIHYPVAIVDQPALSTRAFEVCGGLNAARWWCRAEVSLPIHPWLESAEIHRVVDACNTWAG